MFIATSSSQASELNMVLEEGGEPEWVFTLRHTDQVTQDVSLSLTSSETPLHPSSLVSLPHCRGAAALRDCVASPSVCTVLTIVRWSFAGLGTFKPDRLSLTCACVYLPGHEQPDELLAPSSRDSSGQVPPQCDVLAPEDKACCDSSQTRRNHKTRLKF